jgi:hypothetical protein
LSDLNSVRVIATLPKGVYDRLKVIADAEQRPVGNLAGYILEDWIRSQEDKDLLLKYTQSTKLLQ